MRKTNLITKMKITLSFMRTALVMLSLFVTTLAFAQSVTITGTVKDASGEPIIGASVLQVGTNVGTITDYDGHFTLKTQMNAVLRISYIG